MFYDFNTLKEMKYSRIKNNMTQFGEKCQNFI